MDAQLIKTISQENDTAKVVFEELGTRQRSRAGISLRKLKYDLLTKGNKVVESEFIKLFEKLQDAGVGVIISSRNGKPTKFEWSYRLVDVLSASRDGKTSVKAKPKPQSSPETVSIPQVVKHSAEDIRKAPAQETSRNRFNITVSLPADIRSEDLEALLGLVRQINAQRRA